MIALTMTGQLDLLGYVAPDPAPSTDRTAGVVGFMQAMESVGRHPTMRDVAQHCGIEAAAGDDGLAAAWRDLVAGGRLVGYSVPDEFDPDRQETHWRLQSEVAGREAQETMTVSAGPHLWESEPLVNRPLLLLLDGNNLLYRLWHAVAREPLAVRWGWALNRWRRAVKPDFAIAVFDGDGPTWRHGLYPPYKARRDDDPGKRPSATDWRDAKLECDAAKLRWVQVPGVEADDLIASYAAAAMAIHVDVVIVSSDKDLWQLIRDEPTRVQTLDPGNGQSKGPADVRERWGVEPGLLADLLALAGDSSDNYPGVRNIGPKRAAALIKTNGGVDQILDRINLLPTKLAAKLRAQADEARLFRKLAGLVDNLPLPVSITSAGWTVPSARP